MNANVIIFQGNNGSGTRTFGHVAGTGYSFELSTIQFEAISRRLANAVIKAWMQPWVVPVTLGTGMVPHIPRPIDMPVAIGSTCRGKPFSDVKIIVMTEIIVMLVGVSPDVKPALVAVEFELIGLPGKNGGTYCAGNGCNGQNA